MKPVLKHILIVLLLAGIWSCEADKRFPPKGYIPNDSPKATEKLEAAYFWTSQDKLSSPYWKDANYVEVKLSDLSIRKLYGDGYLNMTGTYSGLSSFNRGKDPMVTLKAGYDDTYLYILVEWKDTTANASYMSWLWDGPADTRKSDSAAGWTSQRNQDNVTLLFDNNATGTKDAWQWSLAYTAPFDMALNLKSDKSGNIIDNKNTITRNSTGDSPRSGPMYEWDGTPEKITLPDGSTKSLDPSYYLADGFKMPVIGNAKDGQVVFNSTADCKFCHGLNGNGDGDGGLLADLKTNKFSREALLDFVSGSAHEGAADQYFGRIKTNQTKIDNLFAFLRSIAGVPGNILITPESGPDIQALTNIKVSSINKTNSKYQVLFRRKLASSNANDVSFDPGSAYTLSIRLSDNDEINYVGAEGIELIFKSNKL